VHFKVYCLKFDCVCQLDMQRNYKIGDRLGISIGTQARLLLPCFVFVIMQTEPASQAKICGISIFLTIHQVVSATAVVWLIRAAYIQYVHRQHLRETKLATVVAAVVSVLQTRLVCFLLFFSLCLKLVRWFRFHCVTGLQFESLQLVVDFWSSIKPVWWRLSAQF
jgi:hypothetical protein